MHSGCPESEVAPQPVITSYSIHYTKLYENPYDLYALESAFVIKKITGGKITVITMGPPQAESIIREAYMMGADEGYIMSDMAFAGSDVLATSYTLAQGIELIGDYDIIICGKQTTDGDTASYNFV